MIGQLPLMDFVGQVTQELADPDRLPRRPDNPLGCEVWATESAKRAIVFAASYAGQKYLGDLKEKQLILGPLADCLIALYAMDSVVARALQAYESLPKEEADLHRSLAKLYCFEARADIFQNLRRVAMMMAEGSELAGKDKYSRAQVLRWMFFEQYSHEPNIATSRFIVKYLGSPPDRQAALEEKSIGGYKALDVMEKQLGDSEFIAGETYSIADIALYAYTHVAHEGGFDLQEYADIRAWLARVEATSAYVPMRTKQSEGPQLVSP